MDPPREGASTRLRCAAWKFSALRKRIHNPIPIKITKICCVVRGSIVYILEFFRAKEISRTVFVLRFETQIVVEPVARHVLGRWEVEV